MPNQYTKKKAAKKAAPNLLTEQFPLMSKCDKTARTMPHFTLLAKDNFTPDLIRKWIAMAAEYGTPDEKITEAKQLLKRIEEWRTNNPVLCKTPD